jgi:transposase
MRLQTILNRVEKHHGFIYEKDRFVEEAEEKRIEVTVRARKKCSAVCSGCEKPRPGYDTLPERRFEFVPLWGIPVFLLYAMRRVDCVECGITVESVPWAEGKNHLTRTYMWFLAKWAKRMSWKETAAAFRTSWENVFRSVEMAVKWGRAHMSLEGITAIGVDEILWHRGHRYLTLVYQIDADRKRLLWVGKNRTVRTLLSFFRWFGKDRSAGLRFVCSDMWKPYLKVIKKKAGQALHVLDRFHIMARLNKALDEVRADEARRLKATGCRETLKHSRWAFLKRPENLTTPQKGRLAELVKMNLKTVRSYLLKEEFQYFWGYVSAPWAGKFLDRWCTRVMHSRIEPLKREARTLRRHRPLLLNWFRAKGAISAGTVEGFNNKAKVVTRRSYGFREFHTAELALYHTLGDLPTQKVTHEFC